MSVLPKNITGGTTVPLMERRGIPWTGDTLATARRSGFGQTKAYGVAVGFDVGSMAVVSVSFPNPVNGPDCAEANADRTNNPQQSSIILRMV